jgi:murein DD-endopeptidase MepM/ murein hydrolase activator NlpD
VSLLHETWTGGEPRAPARFVVPVDYSSLGTGRRAHKYAIDLFAPEGAAVQTVSRGIVILADRDWSPDSLFSTASRKGGNAVIVFDPDNDRFYRYCHLSAVLVSCGEIVTSGEMIGNVGHTGLNASQPGHGGHLHFEANEYLEGHVRALDNGQLRNMLQGWRTSAQ